MRQNDKIVNLPTVATIAPLQNVALLTQLLEQLMNRPMHLPGLGTFYGPSGWGKSMAAAYAANRHNAYVVECKSAWTKKALLLALLKEMGIAPAHTLYDMVDQISEQLMKSGRPLIIDEMDHIVEKKAVDVIRDIYEGSGAPILLIGEELVPTKLRKWERFHNRMLDWVPAQPADLDDTQLLATFYSRDVKIGTDLLRKIQQVCQGTTRRICVNLNLVRQAALNEGRDSMDLAAWGKREFYTGEAPARRVR